MLSKLRVILSIGLCVSCWSFMAAMTQAQFGLQLQIGGPYGGTGLYAGGFNVPFGVGPSIPPTSRAYMGPAYQSGYRGYYGNFGVGPSLGVYDAPAYRGYGYSNPSALDQLQLQQYALLRQQLELQAAQRSLSAPQSYPYRSQSRPVQPSRASSAASDLRPGMVLPDGSTVLSVGPISPAGQSPAAQPSTLKQPSIAPAVPPNYLPSSSSEPKKAAF